MVCDRLNIEYSHNDPSAPDVWRRIAEVLDEMNSLDGSFEFDGKTVLGHRVHEVLVKRSSEHFTISGNGYAFTYVAGGCSLTKMDEPGDLVLWDRWVAALTTDAPLFFGYLFDNEYWRWQNATDPLSYQAAGKPYSHLPMRSNGMPPPLEKLVIDTSRNPGRRIYHHQEGYNEAVGAVMWLGPLFAERTGADLDVLRSADWCTVTEFAPGVLRVQTQETCFTLSEGREAELQDRLRAALFPRVVSGS